ncbi:recombinase family protein [Cryptosporangium phraense]|uniref:Recombinase family protein n=1 Tax=Cryptosporangium phraense TaxID=2593070 RepID=A0A545AVG3_9ACTN|nr:recombinase family protein [Cryptosporangium phraense]TQS45328.1 recombinase family protein [Cryptosporangium phraense]
MAALTGGLRQARPGPLMLGVFAEFERGTIIDRVISGMKRKAAKGLWTGGGRPFGYRVDRDADRLTPVPAEAALVQRIFDLYTRERLGTKAIATRLNNDGLRTRAGKAWSAHTIELLLTNRIYLGEKNFRDITVPGAHPLTGLLRCRQCGRGYIGTSARGRSATYRYYTCWSRARYGTHAGCDVHRYYADELDTAVMNALGPSESSTAQKVRQSQGTPKPQSSTDRS